MNKRYKELPAFETNEFQVGDLVRFYRDICFDCAIILVGNVDGEFVFGEDQDDGGSHGIHFKTCRKLEEVKAREFWIHLGDEATSPHIYNKYEDISDYFLDDVIKVREVLEDE